MPNQRLTEIVVVMDRSGSMETIKGAMTEGFARFIADQRKIPDPCNVTFYRFDTIVEQVFVECPLNDVGSMLLEPRGGTALRDALGTAINQVGARLAAKPEEQRPGKIIVVVITDGHENASTEFSQEQLAAMVKTQSEVYNWQFAFLGANIDSFAVGSAMGISASGIQNFVADAAGAQHMYSSTSAAVMDYRSNTSRNAKLNFTPTPGSTGKTP
jgi:Mg-chelatase subunit ChlD